MASRYKFTGGDSHSNPPGIRNVNSRGSGVYGGDKTKPGEERDPKTESFMLQRGNTMSGMPGFVKTRANGRRGGEAQGGPGVGPKREQYIGRRGGDNAAHMEEPGRRAEGTMTKGHFKGARAGRDHPNDRLGEHGPHPRGSHAAGDRAPPTSHGRLPGGAGIDGHAGGQEAHQRGGGVPSMVPRAQGGKMERLAGRAKTSYEGRRGKSHMY